MTGNGLVGVEDLGEVAIPSGWRGGAAGGRDFAGEGGKGMREGFHRGRRKGQRPSLGVEVAVDGERGEGKRRETEEEGGKREKQRRREGKRRGTEEEGGEKERGEEEKAEPEKWGGENRRGSSFFGHRRGLSVRVVGEDRAAGCWIRRGRRISAAIELGAGMPMTGKGLVGVEDLGEVAMASGWRGGAAGGRDFAGEGGKGLREGFRRD